MQKLTLHQLERQSQLPQEERVRIGLKGVKGKGARRGEDEDRCCGGWGGQDCIFLLES